MVVEESFVCICLDVVLVPIGFFGRSLFCSEDY